MPPPDRPPLAGPPPNPPATRRSPLAGRPGAALAAALLLLAVSACRSSAPPEEAVLPPEDVEGAGPGDSPSRSRPPASVEAEVLSAFERSRDALQRLDADAYLAGYAAGPGLVVLDPAGELVGRDAFERFVREWFVRARERGASYAVITSGERVYPLDERTAVMVVHWSAPGGDEPYRSLLVYRQEGGVWRITAEQSAPLPTAGPPEAEPAR